MEPPVRRSNSTTSGPNFDALPSTPEQRQQALSKLTDRDAEVFNERSSETSSSSITSLGSGAMNPAYGGHQRGGRGGYQGGAGSHRSYSHSSSGSSGQSQTRPVLKPPTVTKGRAIPQSYRRDVAPGIYPITPPRQQQTPMVAGHIVNDTGVLRKDSSTTPPRTSSISDTPNMTSPPAFGRNGRNNASASIQHYKQRRTISNNEKDWAHKQEHKIKLVGISKTYWTKEVYQAMSRHGNVVRIEIKKGSHDNIAWVTFQPPPLQNIRNPIVVGQFSARWEISNPDVRTIPSLVDPSKLYYKTNILSAKSIEFGPRCDDMSMIIMHSVQAREKVHIMLNLDRKELDIKFLQKMNGPPRWYRFCLPFALLSRIYKDTNPGSGQTTLTIPFDSPPQFFVQKLEGGKISGAVRSSFSTNENLWRDWNTWFRETDVIEDGLKNSMQDMPLINHKDKVTIDIGRWTNYRIAFDKNILCGPQFEEFVSALADHGVRVEDQHNYATKDRIVPPMWTLLQEEISGSHPNLDPSVKSGFDELFSGQIHLTFPVRYQLEVCLSNGYLKEHSINKQFLDRLASLDSSHATYILDKVAEMERVYYDPAEIFDIRVKSSYEKTIPSHCIQQRSAVITPTMIHVGSPVIETSNRITRKHAADSERFLRVKFSDEKLEGGLRSMPNNRAKALFDRVHRAMMKGIVVAGRYYEFLGFGNSQFREHGAYFYAPTSSKSADDIRLSLGQFDHIKTVAKFGARMGQCFSTTRPMSLTVKVVDIPDVERNGYCFTDGVGKLSPFLAQMAAQDLGLFFDDPPSLYQYRLGGCKGVLAVDPKVTGQEVHIRPSQRKFEADHSGLEIIRSSSLATPFLNRQIISVLSGLGVADEVFIKKQQEMVNDYEHAMTDEGIAIEKLRRHIDMNQTTLTMAGMVLDGFMKSREPFMISLLNLWRAFTIKNLKEKARIAVEGAFVFGCVDETATLKGHRNATQSSSYATRDQKLATLPEIFIQIDDTAHKGQYTIVKGICVLARNPSLYPSDLRVVRAVDVPALHHLKNVVVLPQTGERDLANMCSGGDLDGDDYMVLWDEEMLPKLINLPPMDFAPSLEQPAEKSDITVEDVIDFFVTYMQNDSLGQIAHAHLAQADRQDEGVHSEIALKLAQLHSQAVDYPKSGIPAQMSGDLRPEKWPHFMEKKHIRESKTYKSSTVLGQLFDRVKLVDFKPYGEGDLCKSPQASPKHSFDPRILNAYDLNEDIISKAVEIKLLYDESIKRLMAKHGIQTECEAWSIFVLAHNHESRDYKFAEEFGRTIGALKGKYRNICFDNARKLSITAQAVTNPAETVDTLNSNWYSNNESTWVFLGPFVAAMYTVTAWEMEAALEQSEATETVGEDKRIPLISFPWLFPDKLGKIATEGRHKARQNGEFTLNPIMISEPLENSHLRPVMNAVQAQTELNCGGNNKLDQEQHDDITVATPYNEFFEIHQKFEERKKTDATTRLNNGSVEDEGQQESSLLVELSEKPTVIGKFMSRFEE